MYAFSFRSRAFSNRWVFVENAQHISVRDGRHKTFEIYAFSNEIGRSVRSMSIVVYQCSVILIVVVTSSTN